MPFAPALIAALLTAGSPIAGPAPTALPSYATRADRAPAEAHRPSADQFAVIPPRRAILRSVPGLPGIPGGGNGGACTPGQLDFSCGANSALMAAVPL